MDNKTFTTMVNLTALKNGCTANIDLDNYIIDIQCPITEQDTQCALDLAAVLEEFSIDG